MKLATGIIFFGLGIVVFGFFFAVMSYIDTNYIQQFVVPNEYYWFSDMLVTGFMPWIVVLSGVVIMLMGGVAARAGKVMQE